MDVSTFPSVPWRPAPAIRFSVGLHMLAAPAAVVAPALWPVWLGGLAANHVALTAAGLWPRSRLLGPNLVRLPAPVAARREVALTFDDGPDPEVTPRVLDLLEGSGARASFFCVGRKAPTHRALVRAMVAHGHTVENHTFTHPKRFSLLGAAAMRAEILAAQQAIAQETGRSPVWFRAPAGLRNPLLDPVLARLGLRLASWTRRGFDTVAADPAAILRRLTRGLAGGDVLLLHDVSQSPVLTVLPALLTALAERGLRAVALPSP